MEKVGEAFLQKLRGKCINLMHLFVATRGEIFSLKFAKISSGGRALLGPAGGTKALPQTP